MQKRLLQIAAVDADAEWFVGSGGNGCHRVEREHPLRIEPVANATRGAPKRTAHAMYGVVQIFIHGADNGGAVRCELDGAAKRAKFGSALENGDVRARIAQHHGGEKAAQTAAGDEDS